MKEWCVVCQAMLHPKHCCAYMGIGFGTGSIHNHQKWNMGKREHARYMIDSAKRDGRQIADEYGNIYGAGVKEYL